MTSRSKLLVAGFSVASSLLVVAAFKAGSRGGAPAETIEESSTPASPASDPHKTAKTGAILVRALSREEGAAVVTKLLKKGHTAVVTERHETRELSRAEVAEILSDEKATVVEEDGAIRVRRDAKPTVRVITRQKGETLADALIREEQAKKRAFSAIESRSRDVGSSESEMDKLLSQDAPYEVRAVEESAEIVGEPRSEARGAGGSWTFEKHGEIDVASRSGAWGSGGEAPGNKFAQPAVANVQPLALSDNPNEMSGRLQLASAGAPLAAIVPPDMSSLPTPKPTPAFCPEGTSEQWKKTKTAKERFCMKGDRGGVPVKQGPFVTTYPSGKTRVEGTYENGRQSGTWITYHPNGRKASEGAYSNGKRIGTWAEYWASGALQSRGQYKSGLKNGKWTWFDDKGRKESEGEIRTADNLEHEQGTWTYFHANGTKRSQGQMKNGRREGRWTEWGVDGRVRSIDDYRGGDKES